jgi:rare lipoprotein A
LLNPGADSADEIQVKIGRIGTLRALATATLLTVALSASPGAGASDLGSLRERAQSLGDRVSNLERELATLSDRQAALEEKISDASAQIGLMELERHDAELAYQKAQERFVERAIEAYKAGSTTRLALLLSTQNLTQMFTVAEAQFASAENDSEALEELEAARSAAEANQTAIDERKQDLLVARARVDAIASETEAKLSTRAAILDRLTAEIAEIERQAREAAALAARPDAALLRLLGATGPAPGIPKGFVGTGVSFEGIASWYGPGFEGNHTANGDVFDPSLYTAASKELPLGSWLYVTYGSRGVVVYVNDRGPYVEDRILDLSQAAAEYLGIGGLGWIRAEILIKL